MNPQTLADNEDSGNYAADRVSNHAARAAALVDVLASTLVADSKARQSLLETTDIARRIERVSAEVAAMTSRIVPSNRIN